MVLIVTHRCLSCLHAGIYRDKAKCGVTVGYYLTSYAYIAHVNNKRGGSKT